MRFIVFALCLALLATQTQARCIALVAEAECFSAACTEAGCQNQPCLDPATGSDPVLAGLEVSDLVLSFCSVVDGVRTILFSFFPSHSSKGFLGLRCAERGWV